MSEEQKMKPIWYFVGWLLLIIGCLVVLAGLLQLFHPESRVTVLANTHPDLWWGALMILAGLVYIQTNKNVTIQ